MKKIADEAMRLSGSRDKEILEELRAIRRELAGAGGYADLKYRADQRRWDYLWRPKYPAQPTYRCGRCKDSGIDHYYSKPWHGIEPPGCPLCMGNGYTSPDTNVTPFPWTGTLGGTTATWSSTGTSPMD